MSVKYFNQLKMLYARNKVTIEGLKQAVVDGRLTEEEFYKITKKEYVAEGE